MGCTVQPAHISPPLGDVTVIVCALADANVNTAKIAIDSNLISFIWICFLLFRLIVLVCLIFFI
jgi:hypothetical protein